MQNARATLKNARNLTWKHYPFKDEALTALLKDPVRAAQ